MNIDEKLLVINPYSRSIRKRGVMYDNIREKIK